MLALRKAPRGLPGTTAAAKGLAVPMDTQVTWGSVLEADITLAKAAGLGFREVFDPSTGMETFEVYAWTAHRAPATTAILETI